MSRIVCLIEQPLDERNYERFGIQTWIDKGWAIEIWDLTPLAYPQVWKDFIESGRKLRSFDGYFYIASTSELNRRYSTLETIGHFIDLTGDSFYSVQAKMHLIRKGAVRVVYASGSIPKPISGAESTLKGRVKKALTLTKNPAKLFKWVFGALFFKLMASQIRPGLCVVSGTESLQSIGSSMEMIHAHNLDYDIYLKIKNSGDISVGGYVVFIDQNYCFHSDFVCDDTPYPTTPKNYFPSVCNALRKISGALDIASCVAAHPRSSYCDNDYFEGVPIRYGATAELIRDCSVVLCHDSTAIQLAVLFEKPVIIATTDELEASVWGASIAGFASAIGKTIINIDRNLDQVDWEKELQVDREKYASYKNKYIKIDGSPERSIWDIVIDHIEKSEGEKLSAP